MRLTRLVGTATVLFCTLMTGGCFDDDRDSGLSFSGLSGDGNSPPLIAGRPRTKIAIGQRYSFAPSASDPDGQSLRFEVRNSPPWAEFDGSTGRLRGDPSSRDIGRHEGIVISVTDGVATRSVGPFAIVVTKEGAANAGPVISGTPATSVAAGQTYSFRPDAVDPDADPISFSVQNLPAWAGFDGQTGRLQGSPAAAQAGTYPGIVITASDGIGSDSLPSFSITVIPSTLPPSGDATFTFADIPEITFIQSYAERQNLGMFHLDTRNRWRPGDLDNSAGWRPQVETRMDVIGGSLDGVSYDTQTGTISYDGNAAAGWALVQLTASARGARSNAFFLRVLAPDIVWGKSATTRDDIARKFPGARKFDYGVTSYEAAWNSLAKGGNESDPDVMLVLDGTYMTSVEAKLTGQVDSATQQPNERVYWKSLTGLGERPWFYLIGEPGRRPRLSGYDVRSGGVLMYPGYRVTAVRNLELETMVTGSSKGWRIGYPNRKYWSQLYVHHTHGLRRAEFPGASAINDDVFGSDSAEGDTTDKTVRLGMPISPNDWKSFFWNNRFFRTGGNVLKHTIYLHGRPDAWLIYNNNSHNGGNQTSAVKATVGHYHVLNSRLSAFADESNPGDPADALNQQLLDVPSASEAVIYNNHLIGGKRIIGDQKAGTRTGLIWFSPRRTLWGTDLPRYPDVTYQSAPFRSFTFSFPESDVSGSGTTAAIAEILGPSGVWRKATAAPTFRPNATGGGDHWSVTLTPDEAAANGVYEVRIRSGEQVSRANVRLTVYRNANYLAVTSFQDAALKSPWYADGPRAYVIDDGAAYWDAMLKWGDPASGRDGRSDPTNPYTLKKYVAFNRFVWLLHPDLETTREEAIRDNGTLPVAEYYSGSPGGIFGAVPPNWVDAGVTFLANNIYEGWRPEDVGTESFLRTDVPAINIVAANQLYGPGQDDPLKRNWPNFFETMPENRRPIFVEVGGERTPANPATQQVPLPDWFRF